MIPTSEVMNTGQQWPLERFGLFTRPLILMDICKEVREISIQGGLNRSQARALETLKAVSQEKFQKVTACGQESSKHKGRAGMTLPQLRDQMSIWTCVLICSLMMWPLKHLPLLGLSPLCMPRVRCRGLCSH